MLAKADRRVTSSDLVFSRIKDAIISGALPPGERLNEIRLAAELELSRTPLRHALQRLEAEGWIARAENGRIRVLEVSEQELRGLYVVRASLEDVVLTEVGPNPPLHELDKLMVIVKEQKHAIMTANIVRLNELSEQFHMTFWSLSRNRVCQEILEKIYEKTKRYRRLAFDSRKLLNEGANEHEEILKSLQKRDLAGARAPTRRLPGPRRHMVLAANR
jgi:DNA-binding GntR family transcriptional regulator